MIACSLIYNCFHTLFLRTRFFARRGRPYSLINSWTGKKSEISTIEKLSEYNYLIGVSKQNATLDSEEARVEQLTFMMDINKCVQFFIWMEAEEWAFSINKLSTGMNVSSGFHIAKRREHNLYKSHFCV